MTLIFNPRLAVHGHDSYNRLRAKIKVKRLIYPTTFTPTHAKLKLNINRFIFVDGTK